MAMYTTVDTIKDELDIDGSEEPYIERQIKQYSMMFDSLAQRSFEYGSHTDVVAQPSGRRRLVLSITPVDSITEIKLDGTTIDASDYYLEDAEAGFVAEESGVWQGTDASTSNITRRPNQQPTAKYEITYEGGYVTPEQAREDGTLTRDLPADIEMAVISAVVSSYHQRGDDPSIESISVGDGSTSYKDGSNGLGRQVPDILSQIASKHKRTVVL